MKRVLFVCTYHGARSRIAELFANQLGQGKIEAFSACFEEESIGPLPIRLMEELGLKMESKSPASVFTRAKEKQPFDYVISMCNRASSSDCPIFMTNINTLYARKSEVLHWSVPDFRALGKLPEEERLSAGRDIRNDIKRMVQGFLEEYL